MCDTDTVLPVRYGMPGPELFDDPGVILGGCLIPVVRVSRPVACSRSCGWSGFVTQSGLVGSVLFDSVDELFLAGERSGLVPPEDVECAAIEVALGWEWGDTRSEVPNTPAHREVWNCCAERAKTILSFRVERPG